MAPVGVSAVGSAQPTPSAAPSAQPAPPVTPIPVDFRHRLAKVNRARIETRDHFVGRATFDLYANDAAREVYDAKSWVAAPGATFVMEHFERGGEAKGVLYMMEKRARGFDPMHGDWRYVVVAGDGHLVADGPLPLCARCHDDAPRDHVFRAPE